MGRPGLMGRPGFMGKPPGGATGEIVIEGGVEGPSIVPEVGGEDGPSEGGGTMLESEGRTAGAIVGAPDPPGIPNCIMAVWRTPVADCPLTGASILQGVDSHSAVTTCGVAL